VLYGKAVKAACFSHVRLFCPDLAYVEYVPGYGDSYIINVPARPVSELRKRFHRSVIMTDRDYDVDLTRRANGIALLNRIRRITPGARDHFLGLGDEIEFWGALKIYRICGRYQHELPRGTSLYPIFFNLGANRVKLIQECEKLSHLPPEAVFSGLMTFLVKMKRVDKIRGISWRYRRDLLDVRQRITNVERKVYRYLTSDRHWNDLVYLIVTL